MIRKRTYYTDFETGRSGFTDGDLPDGPLVEEITALQFYERESGCACGKDAMDGVRCRLGATHTTLAMSKDDEALS